MKIRLRVALSGPEYYFEPGAETDRFGDSEAIRLVEMGIAVPVVREDYERATRPPAPEVREEAKAAPVAEKPFAGKGDPDGDGKAGGARKPRGKRA